MTNRMINNRINKLFDLEAKKRELETQIDALKTELQQDMLSKDVDSVDTGKFIVRWTEVMSNKLDTKKFKADHADMFDLYSVPVNYRRFSYSVH